MRNSSNDLSRPKTDCPDCAELKEQVQDLREARDEALLQLAQEREKSEAMRLNHPTDEHYLGMHRRALLEEPLRYVLVDHLNDVLKRRLRILHWGAKKGTALVARLTSKFRSNHGP